MQLERAAANSVAGCIGIQSEYYCDTTKNSGGLARRFREPQALHFMPLETLGNGVSEGNRKLATG